MSRDEKLNDFKNTLGNIKEEISHGTAVLGDEAKHSAQNLKETTTKAMSNMADSAKVLGHEISNGAKTFMESTSKMFNDKNQGK
ncbi:hypothetical protein [Inconstantimicrobium mannanitabidum]|uniref:Uncharacterized protein n=1 Tax=Inconstantimicrobium mannanitabidum TaxID=1604901 RepID=A0ACB5RG96_9CLOT|nr:hypothetical protein [Clostridium sp. TW13]GKX68111.1 hypothetical protein rsdtw13_33690 [Clostridium sp. TW13]